MRFTGGDQLEGFKRLIHQALMRNELYGGQGGYEIRHAGLGKSGYSFGPVQWDLLNGHVIKEGATPQETLTAISLFKDILSNAKDNAGNVLVTNPRVLVQKVSTKGSTLNPNEITTINAALSSDYGIQAINEAYLVELDTKVARLNDLIVELRAAGRTQAADFIESNQTMQLLLIDYDNQLVIDGIDINGGAKADGKLLRFLKGEAVYFEGSRVPIKLEGDLDLRDFGNFVFHTKHAVSWDPKIRRYGFQDLLRRYSNVLNIARENGLLGNDLGQSDPINLILSPNLLLPSPHTSQPLSPLAWLVPEAQAADDLAAFLPWLQTFNEATQAVSPLILDLDGDGIETTSLTHGAYFDHDGNGFSEQTGWVGSDDGLLVWDRNGDGRINDGTELFGSQTVLANGRKAAHGFVALAELDTNHDGRVDAADPGFANLRVWKDSDEDGYTSQGELLCLSEMGVQSINTGYSASSFVDAQGNVHRQLGSYTCTDGTTVAATDVWFETDLTYTLAEEWLDEPADIAALPDAKGYGKVYDLHQAMVRDASGQLKALVESFVAASDVTTREGLLQDILFKWTGVDTLDPASRGGYIDARVVTAVEAFMGKGFIQGSGTNAGTPNPGPAAAGLLTEAFHRLSEMVYAQLMAQSHLRGLYEKIVFSWDEAHGSIGVSFEAVATELQGQLATERGLALARLREFIGSLVGLRADRGAGFAHFIEQMATQGEDIRAGIGAIAAQAGARRQGSEGEDWLIGGLGSDQLYGGGGQDVLLGEVGNDFLYGEAGDDILNGDIGNDTLMGGPGNDMLDGGVGNDTLDGGTGNELYLFERGWGQDTITDYDPARGNLDTLRFGTGINPSDITVEATQCDLFLRLNGTTDGITLRGWFEDGYRVERIEFAEGTLWEAATLEQRSVKAATSGPDLLYGTSTEDVIDGQGGDDTLYGRRGGDELQGGAGADTLYGQEGNDDLQGGAGNDLLYGDAGDDLLDGGAGNDILTPGEGADLIAFNRGDGQDTVMASPGADNTISLGGGIRYQELSLSRSGNDLLLNTGAGEGLTLKDWYTASGHRSVVNLQVLTEAMAEFDATSSNPLLNRKVQTFNFAALVARFDQSGTVSNWALSEALLDFHLGGSDDAALGGDLTYYYGTQSTLAGIAVRAAQGMMASPPFGSSAQTLQPLASLQEGLVRLS